MLSFKPPVLLALLTASWAAAQPGLTTVQDTLYRADGSRFSGTMYVTWTNFQSGDASNIATSNLTLPIVNGALRVRLVPTTTASAGARYSIRYNSRGASDFTETWAVPPSNVALRVRDVRVSTGTVVGPPPVLSPVQIPDVINLQNELAIRPMKGVGFGISRAAMINQAGQIDAVVGSLSDCVHVDGTSGPCGTGGGGGGGGIVPSYSDNEAPSGVLNGVNSLFVLVHAPSPAESLNLFRNGVLQRRDIDFQLTGNLVTFFVASVPGAGDILQASYRFANPNDPLGSLASPQLVCSSVGTSTSATSLSTLGTCTIPAGLLSAGDNVRIEARFEHIGTTSAWSADVQFGGSTVLTRFAIDTEALLIGEIGVGVLTSNQVWDSKSWGASSSQTTSAGITTVNTSAAVVVDFRGSLAAVGDSVALRSFSVIRYPAQVNP